MRGDRTPPDDLVVVQIDDKTFGALRLQWPFPRSVHGEVIDRIAADRPKVIAYDVQFSETSAPRLVQLASSRTAAILKLTRPKARRALTRIGDEDDLDLVNAVADAGGKVVLSFTETDQGEPNFLGGGGAALKAVDAQAGQRDLPVGPGRRASAASPTRSTV